MLNRLIMSLESSLVVIRDGYPYFVHPITDGIPELQPEILREVVSGIIKVADLNVDKIVTIEAMGIPVATALSLATDIPMLIARKKSYNLPGEIEVDQKTGYSEGKLYINGIEKGERVVLIDDVVSTGGTALATIEALKKAGAIVKGFIAVVEKGRGAEELRRKGIDVKSLVRVEVSQGGVRVVGHI